MTLAELLEDEVTPSAVASAESTPQFIPDTEIDKLASLIEAFAEKYDDTLEQMSTILDKSADKKKVAVEIEGLDDMNSKELSKQRKGVIQGIADAKTVEEIKKLEKQREAIREGKTLSRHPWVIPAVAAGLGAAYLTDSYHKQKQVQMGGAYR